MASTPSGASQRLLTMKFMQRAAAASPTSPGVSQSDSERPSKRAKTESRSALGTPQNQSPSFDQKATQAALDAEDRRRAALIEQQAERLGDAHWKLDPAKLPGSDQRKGAPLKIVQIGFSQIDRRDALETNQGEADGPSFHSYGPKKTKKTKASKDDDDHSISSDSDTDSDSDSSDSSSEGSSEEETPNKSGRASYGTQKRQELHSKKSAEHEKAKKFAEKRRGKEIKLNTLTSISGAGASGFSAKGSNFGRQR